LFFVSFPEVLCGLFVIFCLRLSTDKYLVCVLLFAASTAAVSICGSVGRVAEIPTGEEGDKTWCVLSRRRSCSLELCTAGSKTIKIKKILKT
jgi:hypothetical protein